MLKYLKYLLIILSIRATVKEEFSGKKIIFPYKSEISEICENGNLLNIQKIIENQIFSYFNNSSGILGFQKNFEDHKKKMIDYLEKLKKIGENFTEEKLLKKSENFIKSKILKISEFLEIFLSCEKKNDEIFIRKYLYEKKKIFEKDLFGKIFDLEFIKETKNYLKNFLEEKIPKEIFFEDDFCELLKKIPELIKLYINPENEKFLSFLKIEEKKKIEYIFKNFLNFDKDELKCYEGGNYEFIGEILNNFFTKREISYFFEKNKEEINSEIFENFFDLNFSKNAKTIFLFDKIFLEMNYYMLDFDLENFKNYKKKNFHFSLEFFSYLKNLEKILIEEEKIKKYSEDMENSKNEKLFEILYKPDEKKIEIGKNLKINENFHKMEISKIIEIIYKLYIFARLKNMIPKNFEEKPRKINKILLNIILTENFENHENFENLKNEINLNFEEIRKNLLLIISYLTLPKYLQKISDLENFEKKNIKKIIEVSENFGNFTDLRFLVKKYEILNYNKNNLFTYFNILDQNYITDFFNSENEIENFDDFLEKKISKEKIQKLNFLVIYKNLLIKLEKTDFKRKSIVMKNRDSEKKLDMKNEMKFRNSVNFGNSENLKKSEIMKKINFEKYENFLISFILDKIGFFMDNKKKTKIWKKLSLEILLNLEKTKNSSFLLWEKINLKLVKILKEKIFFNKGFLKLMEISFLEKSDFFENFIEFEKPKKFNFLKKDEISKNIENLKNLEISKKMKNLKFDKEAIKNKILLKEKIWNQKYLLECDKTLFLILNLKKKNLQNSNFSNFANLEKMEKFYENSILRSPLFFDKFYSFLYFFEISKIFDLFSKIKISNFQQKKLFSEIFRNIYKLILDIREKINYKIQNPINYTIKKIENCIIYISENLPEKKECSLSYKNYNKIYWFFKFFKFLKSDQNSENSKNDFFLDFSKNLENGNFIETAPFVIFITNSEFLENMENLCEDFEDFQICVEFYMFRDFKIDLKYYGFLFSKFFEKIFEKYFKFFFEKKIILWNFLESVLRYDKNIFERFLITKDLNLKNKKIFYDFLKIDENDEIWFLDYLQKNFEIKNPKFLKFEKTVDFILKKNLEKKFLNSEVNFEFGKLREKSEIFHFRNLSLFLHFGGNLENYKKILKIVKNQGFLILLFKNEEIFFENDFISKILDLKLFLNDKKKNSKILFDFVKKNNLEILNNNVTIFLKKEKISKNLILLKNFFEFQKKNFVEKKKIFENPIRVNFLKSREFIDVNFEEENFEKEDNFEKNEILERIEKNETNYLIMEKIQNLLEIQKNENFQNLKKIENLKNLKKIEIFEKNNLDKIDWINKIHLSERGGLINNMEIWSFIHDNFNSENKLVLSVEKENLDFLE